MKDFIIGINKYEPAIEALSVKVSWRRHRNRRNQLITMTMFERIVYRFDGVTGNKSSSTRGDTP